MTSERQVQEQVKQLLIKAGWNSDDILEEQSVHSQGKVMRADIVLLCNLYPLAVIEVKRFGSSLASVAAADQAFLYAQAVEIPFAFATDGATIVEASALEDDTRTHVRFPSPSELWMSLGREWDESDPRLFPQFRDPKMTLKIHHAQAVSQAVEAVVSGKKRVLISMATRTGTTHVAFQIAWKLIQSGRCRRMLYLNHTVAQTHQAGRVFEPFDETLLVLTASIPRQAVGGARRVHLGTVAYFTNPREAPTFQELAPSFYDLIVVQNAEHQSTVPILEHFQGAIIVGFTSRDVPGSKITQFYGRPVFTHSLEDVLATEEMAKAPEGFEAIRLDDIAEIRSGVATTKKKRVEGPGDRGLSLAAGRDLLPDGTLDFEGLTRVAPEDVRIVRDGKIDERLLLEANDILVASLSPRTDIKVGIVSKSPSSPTTFLNSLIRIRVNPDQADPRDVFTFLRSDTGQLIMRRFATALGTAIHRISIRGLRQMPVFLPKNQRARDTALEELGAVSIAKQSLKDEILPLIGKLEQAIDPDTETSDQQLESIARRLQRLAAVLAPPKLPDRVMADYPTPIAVAYRRFHDARFNIYERVLRLRDVFEAAAFYVYNIVLADVLRRLDPAKYYIEDRGARRAYNGYSMSARMDFVEEVLRIARSNQGKDLFIPELVGSSVAALAKQLQGDLRNRLSHTATATESQQGRVIREFEPVVEELLSDLDFLSGYRLVRITSFFYERGSLVRRMEVHHGVVPELDELILPDDTELTKADHDHLVLLDAGDQVLDLHPLYQLIASEETRHENHLCFFKQRKASQQLLEGESVQGSFGVRLEGFRDLEALQSRILDTLPEG